MNKVPKRSDPIYKEIEEFKDYELTECIVYEMLERASEKIKSAFDDDFLPCFYTDSRIKTSQVNLYGVCNLYSLMSDFYPNYKEVTTKKAFEAFKQLPECENKDKDFIHSNFKENLEFYIDSYSNDLSYFIDNFLLNDDQVLIPQVINLKREKIIIDKTGLKTLIKEFKFTYDVEKTISLPRSRPRIYSDSNYERNLEINFALPLNELIATITELKNLYDKNNLLFKTPIELLGTELQEADDISKMCTVNKNGKELCFDGRKGITRTQKLADMFFIYDMVKNGYKELRIRTAISEYYEAEYNKTTDISDATFRKYRDIAKDYIDNERYKELVTGVKS